MASVLWLKLGIAVFWGVPERPPNTNLQVTPQSQQKRLASRVALLWRLHMLAADLVPFGTENTREYHGAAPPFIHSPQFELPRRFRWL